MKYKGLELDEFQEKAIRYLDENSSVIVSAPTGSGKTLIADYIINKYVNSDFRIIYTAPIKALSNQKYTDFCNEYGKENIGLVTGDTVINPVAKIVVMTTEIYRNQLLSKDVSVADIKYVIFDEIHYMSDIERGTVWEESIIFSPPHIRFLCLSATIPNKDIFAKWIETIKKHPVKVVSHNKRSVPLDFILYDSHNEGRFHQMSNQVMNNLIARRASVRKVKSRFQSNLEKDFKGYDDSIKLIRHLKKESMLSAIFFFFSRKQVEDYAMHTFKRVELLTEHEKNQIREIIQEKRTEEKAAEYNIKHFDLVKEYLLHGIGIHHAGLFPIIKELVEILFAKGLVKVLFATETFAVGINMPAKTVVFNSLRKFDGLTFRSIHSQEFFQMAGRAGRRGIDKKGNVIIFVDDSTDLFALKRVISKESEPIVSQFKLSHNTILNLINNHTDAEIEIILKSNFDYFVRKAEQNIRIKASYNSKLKNLIELGYVVSSKEAQADEYYVPVEGKSHVLTDKGKFATKIYAHEITITELFYSGFYKNLDEFEINILLGSIVYEARKNDSFTVQKNHKHLYEKLIAKLKDNDFLFEKINKKIVYRLISLVYLWSDNAEFSKIVDLTNLQEGDLIRFFKQIIDFQRQIRRATNDFELASKIDNARLLIDRDVVAMTL